MEKLMSLFSLELKAGQELPQALREAKLLYLDQAEPSKAHPYYWASAALIGKEEAIELPAPWYSNWLIWAAAVILLLIAFRRKIGHIFN